jgi:hypothetical protein
MGLAKHNPGGQWRLGLSATAASAVLYSAIVLFGVGSASPSALDAGHDPHASAVLIQPDADTVSGSVQRLPQASPEPGRHRLHARANQPRRVGVAPSPTTSAPATVASPPPAAPRTEEHAPPSVTRVATASVASVAEPLPVVASPVVQVPAVTVPLVDLSVQLPELPSPPPLSPLPLQLP